MSGNKFTFGKYKDSYVCHIVQTNPGYVVWFFENVEGAERYVTEDQYQDAQQGVEDFEELRSNVEGVGSGPDWWKD